MTSYESDHDLDSHTAQSIHSLSRFSRHVKPLIDSARNGWQPNIAYHPLTGDDDNDGSWLQRVLSIIAAPRFRRYVLVYLSLFLLGWASWAWVLYPRIQERNSIIHSLDPASKDEAGGWFGTNSKPQFDDLIQVQALDPDFLPKAAPEGEGADTTDRRLIVVGDVHGCKDALVQLLDDASFTPATDHLIFTGDLINKGPDSAGVVDLAREHSASCVRGNHEDRVLLLRRSIVASNAMAGPQEGDDQIYTSKELGERALARSLSDEQAKWLEACPVILDVGMISGMGRVVVAHGGLVPGVDLHNQDPSSVMNMRTIDLKTHVPSSSSEGLNWAKMFNKHQSNLHASLKASKSDPESEIITVIYGHDAKTSLNIRAYTKGLDSGCVKGGKLTALIIEPSGEQKLVQVKCRKYSKD
ncbi:hypothetical protein N7478_005491 [Penicillium angulare]|uniref:uncharacterized protein n=1 Tax=Penicillium angulare TaxID=116970 RepID=UPI002541BB14|nr:uncharacterized protein N7478_005491 [Penicillium angulare]KAJ5280119.1 hypothetical protein N7478_005491 [Penicillium angulare]